MKMTTLVCSGVLAIALITSLLGIPGTSSAGPEQWASIKTTTECSLDGGSLTVTVGWVHTKLGNEIVPDISNETISLEQRVGRQWISSGELFNGAFGGNTHNHLFSPVIDPDATSLRVIVVLTVENASPNRKDGRLHTARCDVKIPK